MIDMADPQVSRRDFLKLAVQGLLGASALLGLGGLLRFLAAPDGAAQPSEFDLGPAAKYPAGSRTPIPEANALLLHTGAGFRALSLVCTHLGCTVKPAPEGFACPCHNSHYDPDGKVVKGPAARPLQTLRVKETPDGRLILSLAAA